MRGSNRLEHCDILLIVGTPALRPEQVRHIARALYFGDARPLDETAEKVEGEWQYRDPRMQRVADALSQAEMTQCAHRNRPLRYDERTVVTLCVGAVDFLPETVTIKSLPHLTEEGTRESTANQTAAEQRMAAAAEALRNAGERVSASALAALAKVRKADACTWLRAWNETASPVTLCTPASGSANAIKTSIAFREPVADNITSQPVRSFADRLAEMVARDLDEDAAIALLIRENGRRRRGDVA